MDVIAIGESLVSLTSEPKGLLRHAAHFTPRVAGSETNMLIGLSRLGHQAGWISKLGNDELGKMIQSTVRGEGVDTSQVLWDEANPTGIFFKERLNDSDVRISYYREHAAATTLDAANLDEAYFSKAKYLFMTGITPALSKSCRDTIWKAIEMAKRNDITIVFDPNIRRKLWEEKEARETLLKMAGMADIILPGKGEGAFLFDTDQPDEMADKFLELGVSLVVIKLGAEGAYYASADQRDVVPGFPVEHVVDPVGAGDGFAAGLVSGLLDKQNVRDAVERACAVGALATMVNGDFEGLPDRDRLTRMLNQTQQDDVNR